MPEIKGIFLRETEKAIQIQQKGDEPVWIPLSQVSYRRITPKLGERIQKGDDITMKVSDWISREKNLQEEP